MGSPSSPPSKKPFSRWIRCLDCFSTLRPQPSPPGSPVIAPRRSSKTSTRSLEALSIPLPRHSLSFRRRFKMPSNTPVPAPTTTTAPTITITPTPITTSQSPVRTLVEQSIAPTRQELTDAFAFPTPETQLKAVLEDPLIKAYFRKLLIKLKECKGEKGSRVVKIERVGTSFSFATGAGSATAAADSTASLDSTTVQVEGIGPGDVAIARVGVGAGGEQPGNEVTTTIDLGKEVAENVVRQAVEKVILGHWEFKDEVAFEADEPGVKHGEVEYLVWWVVVFVENQMNGGVFAGGSKGGKSKEERLEGFCWMAWGVLKYMLATQASATA